MMGEEILKFEIPTIEFALKATEILQRDSDTCCEGAYVNALIWHKHYGHRIAFSGNDLYIKLFYEGRHIFLLPFSEDMRSGCEKIFAYCRQENIKPFFLAPDGERLEKFKALYGKDFEITESRDDFEYIYSREKLATLSGKKFHSKRNHISAFTKRYDWKFEPLCDSNSEDILSVAEEWVLSHGETASLLVEKESLPLLLKNRELLGIKGGLIRVDNKAVSFTIGSPISANTFDVHMEKALDEYSGAYTVINKCFAEYLDCQYLNREDDMGLDGLRRAKLSYQPDILLKKYTLIYKGEL